MLNRCVVILKKNSKYLVLVNKISARLFLGIIFNLVLQIKELFIYKDVFLNIRHESSCSKHLGRQESNDDRYFGDAVLHKGTHADATYNPSVHRGVPLQPYMIG